MQIKAQINPLMQLLAYLCNINATQILLYYKCCSINFDKIKNKNLEILLYIYIKFRNFQN